MKDNIEYAMVGIMLAGLILMFHNRLKVGSGNKSKGIGLRFIQYTVLIFAFPIIIILALESIISGEATATLIGTITGYTLSSIGNTNSISTETKNIPQRIKKLAADLEINTEGKDEIQILDEIKANIQSK